MIAASDRVFRQGDRRPRRERARIERYVLGIAPAGFAAGRYRLRLDFVDPASGGTARSEIPVLVE